MEEKIYIERSLCTDKIGNREKNCREESDERFYAKF
jgi:hypothetical protein